MNLNSGKKNELSVLLVTDVPDNCKQQTRAFIVGVKANKADAAVWSTATGKYFTQLPIFIPVQHTAQKTILKIFML